MYRGHRQNALTRPVNASAGSIFAFLSSAFFGFMNGTILCEILLRNLHPRATGESAVGSVACPLRPELNRGRVERPMPV